jgi:serine/threonine protein kinase
MYPRDYAAGDTIAGCYRVLRIFGGAGASGMGVVYLVDECDAPEPFVLKACQGGDATLTSRFKREAEIWVSIGSHPNVTKALWVRHLDEQLFVAAEYINGAENGIGSLADMLAVDVAPRQIIRWAMQFCSGLGHALARGLIAHRDIKPANLLLTREGDLKIADFGLGKNVPSGPSAAADLSSVNTGIAGTPSYMAPEQIVGMATDHRCDIYAFGIVLYQLCSGGAYPYEINLPPDAESFMLGHLRGAVRPLANPFWPVIDRCLARSARNRWQSPEELAAAVRTVAAQLGLPCPPFVSPQPVALEELYTKAQSLSALGRPEDALSAIDQYLGKAPDAFWAWTERGRILMELQRNTEAEEATRLSLTCDSSNTHAWNNLGVILQRLSRIEESCSAFDHALECDPFNGGTMMNAAQSLCALGRYERAASLLCTALQLTPEKQSLLFNAGNLVGAMLQSRAFDPAERVARALVTADAGNSQGWHNLAARGNSQISIPKHVTYEMFWASI